MAYFISTREKFFSKNICLIYMRSRTKYFHNLHNLKAGRHKIANFVAVYADEQKINKKKKGEIKNFTSKCQKQKS
ncbi:hypothetical protein BpHYR1_005983 [Brachionus plicatilis]|uniref:Uncharacterized protein n=1 Tax=Brachionus plicatilis TaxID=10195 RepID=A0A3M7SWI7_BRAPC|nr:hypothetical protein BpHYR1_005983 [Brachionus plicatilis]